LLKLSTFPTQQQTFSEAKRIYWCVCNCPSG